MDQDAARRLDPAAPELSVKPLVCAACGGPVPLTDADRTRCPYCGAPVEIPADLRALRAAGRRSAVDHARVEAAYRKLGTPPGPLLHAWAGTAGGLVHVLWIGTTAFLRVWLWLLFAYFKAFEGVDDIRWLGVLLALPLAPLAALFFGVGQGLRALTPRLHWDPTAVLGFALSYALVGAAVYLVIAVPIAIYRFADAFAQVRHRLQAGMAARPPSRPGGPALCRHCGAALTVPSGALGVRCDYCHSDNLVALPPAWVTAAKLTEADQHREVLGAVSEERQVRDKARNSLVALLLLTAAVVPVFAFGGVLTCRAGLIPGQTDVDFDDAILDHEIVRAIRPIWHDGKMSQAPLSPALSQPPFRDGFCAKTLCELDYDAPLRMGETLVLETDAEAPERHVRFPGQAKWEREAALATGRFTAPYSGWFRLRLVGDLHQPFQVGWHVERP